jgi:hypothetical protein
MSDRERPSADSSLAVVAASMTAGGGIKSETFADRAGAATAALVA